MLTTRPIALPVTRKSAPPLWLAPDRQVLAGVPSWAQTPADETTRAAAAAAEIERQCTEALSRAEAEGRARGEAAVRDELEQSQRRIAQILDELLEARRRIFASMEEQMVDLALCVARAVLDHEVAADREYLLRLTREAIALVAGEDEVTIAVAPSDHELLAGRLPEITQDSPRQGAVQLRADEHIDSGCVVETRLARVDATVATRLRTIAAALRVAES